jgi:hypothetical protein
MNRLWHVLHVLVIASGALIVGAAAAHAATKVIYMGAPDCPYCRQYETLYERDLTAACRAHGVQYRRIMLSRISDAGKAEKWPADIRPLFAGLGGTPHFLIVENGHVIQEVNKINAGRMAVASTCKG